MTFFNKKEEVIDIKLTQFGKDLLSRGYFKPVYYRFFDDDILYNSQFIDNVENQNDVESRILENTPKLKTQHLTYGVETNFNLETERIVLGESEIFKTITKNADPSIQERILLYPLHEYSVGSENAPSFNIRNHGRVFEEGVTFLKLTDSGIKKNIPQISVFPKYTIKEDRSLTTEPAMIDDQTHIDLVAEKIVFADNSSLSVESENFVIDVEENDSFYGLDNFELQIFEVIETDGKDDTLRRLVSHEEINKYFDITTDQDIKDINVPTSKSRNFYKRGES